jgi:hypothetical protein
MVNRRFTGMVAKFYIRDAAHAPSSRSASASARWRPVLRSPRAFAQILGKLFYFELSENLQRILREYGQKPHIRANAPFNAPC